MIEIRETGLADLESVRALWADGDVMRFVGFPEGLRKTEEEMRGWLRWIEAKDFDRQEKIEAVTRLYDAIGIRQLCEQKINSYFEEAKQYLDQVSVSEERKQPLRQYTAEMVHRES